LVEEKVMKNLLKKHMLLALFVGISINYVSSMIATHPDERIPFSVEYQKMLDDIVVKFKADNPGDYKGYVVGYYPFFINCWPAEKKIFVRKDAISKDNVYDLSKEEFEFLLGRVVGSILTNMDQKNIIKQARKRADNHGFGFSLLGSAAGVMPIAIISRRNDWSYYISLGAGVVAGLVGSLISQTVADYYGYNFETYAASDLQKMEYDLDEMSVQTLDCHDAAIKLIGKYIEVDNSKKTINIRPSNKDRIARIKEMINKKQQVL